MLFVCLGFLCMPYNRVLLFVVLWQLLVYSVLFCGEDYVILFANNWYKYIYWKRNFAKVSKQLPSTPAAATIYKAINFDLQLCSNHISSNCTLLLILLSGGVLSADPVDVGVKTPDYILKNNNEIGKIWISIL